LKSVIWRNFPHSRPSNERRLGKFRWVCDLLNLSTLLIIVYELLLAPKL